MTDKGIFDNLIPPETGMVIMWGWPWVSVKDRLPNDIDPVLCRSVYIDMCPVSSMDVLYYDWNNTKKWYTNEVPENLPAGVAELFNVYMRVTHWMRLPNPPK